MRKSQPAALLSLLLGCALLPTLGCGGDGVADATVKNETLGPAYKDPPVDPNQVVDSQTSWKKFMAEAQLPERLKAAEEHFKLSGPNNVVQIRFTGKPNEMEFAQFGKSHLKNIDPDRLYEVGVVRLAAKESRGSNGYQIREYVLKFITPKRDGNWQFLMGGYTVPKSQGDWTADPQQQFSLEDKMYERGYLKVLFVKQLADLKKEAGR